MSIRTLLVGSAAVALALTACSSSKSGTTSSAPAGAGSSSAATGSTVSLDNGIVVGPNGHTLYFNTVDTASSIKCTGECASIWPPLTGSVTAGTGVTQSDFGTTSRPDGTMQVTYFGHPLYYFAQDSGMTDKKGDGLADGGGTWHATTPQLAQQLQSGGSPASSSSSSGGGYGNGY